MEFLILCVFYGTVWHCSMASTDKSHLPQRLYYISVEQQSTGPKAFYDRLHGALERIGIDAASHFPVMRLYSMGGEVSSSSVFKGA